MTNPWIQSRVAEAKRIFRDQGLAPKKWMGQNLLVDDSYLERIVQAAHIAPGERVVEVGAGLGVLTAALVRHGAHVWALEIDSGFCRVLEEKFRDSQDVTLIHADALKFDFRALARSIGKLRVAANLPYSISSRLIFTFHENCEIFSSLYILLQKEVAERLVAPSGTRDYGVLTVLLGVSAEVEILFDIPPKAFFPVPEVVSSLVRVSFPELPPVEVQSPQLLVRLVKASFSGRRKTLRNTLRSAPIAELSPQILVAAAEQAGIDLGRRAETLSPQEFATFADAILSQSNPPD
jgi:16S rRNA (adenine1518-N6/adenine1519-N6)-dimethyltransferase